MVDRFFLAVGLLPAETLHALDELHIYGHFDLQHVDAVAVFAELAHALGNDVRLFPGVFQSLLVRALFVADKFQKEWNVIGAALVADALNPGVLFIVHILRVVRRVVEKDLHAVGTRFLQSARGPVIEQVAESSGTGLVISGFFIRQQQSRVLGAAFRGRQSPLRIKQNRAGMRRQNFGDQRLEFFHHGVADFAALFLAEGFLQRAALIHRRGGDYTFFVGNFSETRKFARG